MMLTPPLQVDQTMKFFALLTLSAQQVRVAASCKSARVSRVPGASVMQHIYRGDAVKVAMFQTGMERPADADRYQNQPKPDRRARR